jgi:hypothetical protein
MLAGEAENIWLDKSLNDQMNDFLGISLDLCRSIVGDMKVCLQGFENDLQCLDVIRSEKHEVSFCAGFIPFSLRTTYGSLPGRTSSEDFPSTSPVPYPDFREITI